MPSALALFESWMSEGGNRVTGADFVFFSVKASPLTPSDCFRLDIFS